MRGYHFKRVIWNNLSNKPTLRQRPEYPREETKQTSLKC